MTSRQLDDFTRAYLTAALFTDDPEPHQGEFAERDDWSIDLIHPDSLEQAIADCMRFQALHQDDISSDLEHAGRDFWYTRNGHGVGFWDGDWPEEVGKRLTEACKGLPERNVSFDDTEGGRVIYIE